MRKMPDHGLGEDAVFEKLTAFGKSDVPWREGKTLAYIYDGGPDVERVAKRAYMQYLTENALDPTVYPSLARMERDLIGFAAAHLNGSADVVGNFTSGGTESCMLAVKTARDCLRRKNPEVATPEIVMPVTAHAAFHKAAEYFGLKKVLVPVDVGTFKAIPSKIARAITPNTALVVASAVSYAHGVVDPIEEIGAIAQNHDVLFHVDGCIGGFILPYFRRLGAPAPAFDFSVPGVTSMSMDWHKYAYCPKGASVVVYRDKALRRFQLFATTDWTGYPIVNPTMLSAKSGGPLAAAWAVINFLGDDGYLRLARRTLAATQKILEGIKAVSGLKILGTPEANLIAFTSEEFPIFNLIDEMKEDGWYMQPQFARYGSPENIHLSIGQSALEKADAFVADLARATERARAVPQSPLVALVKAELAKISSDAPPDPKQIETLMSAIGISGGRLPERMADLNQILNILPAEITKVSLTDFFNDLIVQPRSS
jgi:sphinganine-1-phosphate aldolase